MPVKRFLRTKLFKLLTDSISDRKINSSELSVTYDDFVRQLFLFCQNKQDIILLYFTINYTIAEIKELNVRLESEYDNSLFDIRLLLLKLSSILDSTFRIVQFQLENPNIFIQNEENSFVPDVYLANDVDMIDIMELICGLFYSHSFRNRLGKPVTFLI